LPCDKPQIEPEVHNPQQALADSRDDRIIHDLRALAFIASRIIKLTLLFKHPVFEGQASLKGGSFIEHPVFEGQDPRSWHSDRATSFRTVRRSQREQFRWVATFSKTRLSKTAVQQTWQLREEGTFGKRGTP
jgi:hypothetical protein